jgi:anti-anti-sigma regulatory factor
MLNIQRSTNGGVSFILVGRIEVEDIAELRRLFSLEAAGDRIVLDLTQVTLVGREAVYFLARCEADGIKLVSCPPYIREWLDAEKGNSNR